MELSWAKRGRDGGGRVEWIGLLDGRVTFAIWQFVNIKKGKRSIAFRLYRDRKIIGDFPTLQAAKDKAEKLA